jgi:hypothetical protein
LEHELRALREELQALRTETVPQVAAEISDDGNGRGDPVTEEDTAAVEDAASSPAVAEEPAETGQVALPSAEGSSEAMTREEVA